jgi:signal recognition particle receptor subunit beta
MAQILPDARELALKVVYYGPALSGKTTNLQALFHRVDPRVRGRLMTLDTKDDRTLFFDLMPVFFTTASGVRVKIKLFTVPGQVMHESTRRVVLQGSDGVVFVADSRRSEAAVTKAYWDNMLANLEANGLDPATLPLILQLNKRDLCDVRGDDEFQDLRERVSPIAVPAVAVRGEGVVETLHTLLSLVWRNVDQQVNLGEGWGVSEQEFLAQVFSHVDLRGTAVTAEVAS